MFKIPNSKYQIPNNLKIPKTFEILRFEICLEFGFWSLGFMKIGILGGSFNPPHIGHILVAQQVLDFTSLDEVWFLPAFKHTFDKPLAPVSDRLAMTRLISLPKTRVSTLEIDHQLSGDTIELIPILKEKYPQDNFTFIMGSDQLAQFTKWGSWEQLLAQIPFLIVPRAGFALEPLYKNMQPLKHELFITTNVSSSMIRQRIKRTLSITHLVTEEIEQFIKQNKLYV
ncbi:nicotinate (nicotinamide) nucleotide adenylyltransferase [Candidatus Microgenomates bacterium]|nr:MAG: nicotinate (nicotinamide) nucleotide adenylyltransferase [Candidatus Microgenomates bacterium]